MIHPYRGMLCSHYNYKIFIDLQVTNSTFGIYYFYFFKTMCIYRTKTRNEKLPCYHGTFLILLCCTWLTDLFLGLCSAGLSSLRGGTMFNSARLPNKVLWRITGPEQIFAELQFTHLLNLTQTTSNRVCIGFTNEDLHLKS